MKTLQYKVSQFCKENKIYNNLEINMLDLASETGELAKEVLKMSSYGKQALKYKSEFELEIGDVLYALINIANHFQVDMEHALEKVLEKYKMRLQKGEMGSDNHE